MQEEREKGNERQEESRNREVKRKKVMQSGSIECYQELLL